jgi:hypothetical protein
MDIPSEGADLSHHGSDSTLVISGGEGYIDFRVGTYAKFSSHVFMR